MVAVVPDLGRTRRGPGCASAQAYSPWRSSCGIAATAAVGGGAGLVRMQEEDVLHGGDLITAGQSATKLQCGAAQQPARRAHGVERVVLTHRVRHQRSLQSPVEAHQVNAAEELAGLVGGSVPLAAKLPLCLRINSAGQLVAHQREHQIRPLLQRRFAKLVRRKSAAAVVSEVGSERRRELLVGGEYLLGWDCLLEQRVNRWAGQGGEMGECASWFGRGG